jgi:enoyl-CoA hydratase/carnithine racemase
MEIYDQRLTVEAWTILQLRNVRTPTTVSERRSERIILSFLRVDREGRVTESFEFITYEKGGHIAYLTLNRPDVMNALHPPAHAECARALEDFEADVDAWVMIITGAGDRAFSAGMDLRYRAQEGAASVQPTPGGFAGLTNPRHARITKPVIAAINGYALGGGLELAMACDIVIAADNATLGLPEVKRGIIAGAGGVHRLPRQVPLKVAMGYLLTGKSMTAAEAERWGLVNEVVPAAELMDAARRWAAEIIEAAPLSVRASKEAAMLGLETSLEEAYNGSYPATQKMRGSNDSREGVVAFAERRKPNWTGT